MRFPTMALDGLQRPVVPIMLESPGRRRLIVDALVDTGSDVTLFPEGFAAALDINLDGLPEKPLTSALGVIANYRESEVFLELRRDSESVRWRTSVGFLPLKMGYSILGTNGFFEFFHLGYNAGDSWIDLIPLAELPQ